MAAETVEELAAHLRAVQRLVPFLDAIRSIAEISWRRAESLENPLASYRAHVHAALARLSSVGEGATRFEVLARLPEQRPSGLLVIGSERGLCGPFNQRLVAFALREMRSRRERGQQIAALCAGTRARQLLEESDTRLAYFRQLPSLTVPTYADLEDITLDVLDFVEAGELGAVFAVRNKPVQRFQYEPSVTRLFPPEVAPLSEVPVRAPVHPPEDLHALFNHLVTERFLVGLFEAVLDSAISEQLARIYTMRIATENAKKMVENLSVRHNRARSNAITKALLEVVGGYAATVPASER